MVGQAQRRTWVRWVQNVYAVSKRTACDAGDVARSSVGYASIAAPQEPLRQRLRELHRPAWPTGIGACTCSCAAKGGQ